MQYQLMDGILYYVANDKTLWLIPPIIDRKQLFEEAHCGPFGAHLREAKVHGELYKHYWWPKMRSYIRKWCNGCLVCATRQPSRAVHSPLNPIPVEGPFYRVGVDVIQFPKSQSGNRYAVVLNQARASRRPARTWFLKITFILPKYVCVCVCVCMCHPRCHKLLVA